MVNVAGRPAWRARAWTALNEIGFAVTEDDLTLPEDEPVYEGVRCSTPPATKLRR